MAEIYGGELFGDKLTDVPLSGRATSIDSSATLINT
jgi:hypothetical protein